MTIIIWDTLIEFISGHWGDQVYYKRGGTCCSRSYVKPNDPETHLQLSRRSMFSMAVRSWQGLAAPEKEEYAKRAADLNMSGYNLYISEYMKAGISGKRDDCVRAPMILLRSGSTSPSLPPRFSFASASILPLSGRFPGPESPVLGGSWGIIPP